MILIEKQTLHLISETGLICSKSWKGKNLKENRSVGVRNFPIYVHQKFGQENLEIWSQKVIWIRQVIYVWFLRIVQWIHSIHTLLLTFLFFFYLNNFWYFCLTFFFPPLPYFSFSTQHKHWLQIKDYLVGLGPFHTNLGILLSNETVVFGLWRPNLH